MRRICPKCGNNTFITSAHVMQDWEVEAEGNYLDTVNGCVQVDQDPDQDNSWSCSRCGTEAINEEAFTYDQNKFTIHWVNNDPVSHVEYCGQNIGNEGYISVCREGNTIHIELFDSKKAQISKTSLYKEMSGTAMNEIPFILEALFGTYGVKMSVSCNYLYWYELVGPDWKEKDRYIQYHPDDNNIWSYMQSQGHSCDCGSKLFHYEENNGRIEAHCNACGKLIGEPFTEDRCKIIRSEGIWR